MNALLKELGYIKKCATKEEQEILDLFAAEGMAATIIKKISEIHRLQNWKDVLSDGKFKELDKASSFCDNSMTIELNKSKHLGENPEIKANCLINKLNIIKSNVDLRMVHIEGSSIEIKETSRKAAQLCLKIIIECNKIQTNNILDNLFHEKIKGLEAGFVMPNIDARMVLDLLENERRNGFDLPTITISKHYKNEKLIKVICTEKFWKRSLRNAIKLNRETVFLHLGAVGKNGSKYASDDAIYNWKKRKEAMANFLKNSSVLNPITGETFALEDIASTPQKRFAQMYTFIKGIEKYSQKKGMNAAMLTLTAPREYHPNPTKGINSWEKSGYATMKEAQDKLKERWHLLDMRFKSGNMERYGARFVEPHSDGCPHWHVLLFYSNKDKQRIQDDICALWTIKEITEKSIAANWKDINRSVGSAVNYATKYISKNCNLVIDEKDTEETKAFNAIAANMDINNFRSHQFFGITKCKTLWDMYRKQRNNDTISDELEIKRRDAACKGDFCEFLELIKTDKPKIITSTKKDGFGDIVKTNIGYKTINGTEYITKTIDYLVIKTADIEKAKNFLTDNGENKELTRTFAISKLNQLIKSTNILIQSSVKLNNKYPRKADEYYNISVNKDSIIKIINKFKRNRSSKKHLGDFLGTNHILYKDDPVFWV